MTTRAAYDEIADWYEHEFLGPGDSIGVDASLRALLDPGRGPCLEVCCGTGVHARTVRELGYTPVGVDLSAGMLRYATGRLPVARADACRLPVATGSVPVVLSMMAHTDLPDYPAVLAEVARVLAPGGVFVHVGVHPCFCGGFADRSDPDAVLVRRGYLDGRWTTESWTDRGVRDKVGAVHYPLPVLLNAVHDAGLRVRRFVESGGEVPTVLSFRATRAG
jgi:SAM-dependent methyltransferase